MQKLQIEISSERLVSEEVMDDNSWPVAVVLCRGGKVRFAAKPSAVQLVSSYLASNCLSSAACAPLSAELT